MYRQVSTDLWSDDMVLSLSPEQKLVFLYLHTSPYTSPCAIFKLQPKTMAFHLGMNEDGFKSALQGLCATIPDFVAVDWDLSEVGLLQHPRQVLITASKKALLSVEKSINEVRSTYLLKELISRNSATIGRPYLAKLRGLGLAGKISHDLCNFGENQQVLSKGKENEKENVQEQFFLGNEERIIPTKQPFLEEKVYAPAADKSTLHEQEGVYREGLRRVIRKRIYSRVSKAAKERGMGIDDLIDSFIEYCFASGRKYNEKGTGLAQLFDKHLQFIKIDHVPDHSEYDRIAGIVVDACEKAWLRVSPGHNFPYGYNNMGRMPEAWWEGERAAIVGFLSKKVITSQELNTIYKNLAKFNPDAVYSWQQMDRFKIKTYL